MAVLKKIKPVKLFLILIKKKTLRVYENIPPFIPYFLNKDTKWLLLTSVVFPHLSIQSKILKIYEYFWFVF